MTKVMKQSADANSIIPMRKKKKYMQIDGFENRSF